MIILSSLRSRSRRCAGTVLALLALLGVTVAAPACVMDLTLDIGTPATVSDMPDHDCPHCPPSADGGEVARQSCDTPATPPLPRPDEPLKIPVLMAAAAGAAVAVAQSCPPPAGTRLSPAPRSGPRPHLLNAQFNE